MLSGSKLKQVNTTVYTVQDLTLQYLLLLPIRIGR